MKAAAPKKKAPVRLSGNAGTRYENEVAARFLLDMLGGTNSVGVDFGRILRIDWQARDLGWLTDDIVLTCQDSENETRRVGLSLKSNKQITSQGFPDDFVDLAWGQWIGARTAGTFNKGKDAVALVTANISNDVFQDWSALLREVLATTPDRVAARLSTNATDGSQASEVQRSLVGSFACPARYNEAPDQIETIRLLHDVRVLVFDFNHPTSRDLGHALADCQRLLASGAAKEATDLWERLVGIADELRPAGGALDLPALRAKLRDNFQLQDHPDYRADFAALRKSTAEEMDYIETRIGGVAQLPREDDKQIIRERLASNGACLLAGESGNGKSALLKEIALADYPLTVWLSRDALDHPSTSAFTGAMGLRHPLVEVLRHASTRCLVVFDGIEGLSDRALRLCASIAASMSEPSFSHVNVAFTAQSEALAKIDLLRTLGVPAPMLAITPLGRADEGEVQKLLASFPELRWMAARPELAPLLTNLKVLDWFARLGPRQETNGVALGNITDIIDYVWGLWTESPQDGLTRSHVLMHLAKTEAETFSHGLSRTDLDTAAQGTLRDLTQSGLIRLRDDRVYFAHDLLGDWARLKILAAENATSDKDLDIRAASPPWQQAVRLFGQRLLEKSPETRKRWQEIVESPGDGSPSAGIMRDLLLDALFLAPNAAQLFDDAWDMLIANDGKLLKKLLDRFLIVATVPDPRIATIVGNSGEASQFEHLVRIPYWLYWPPVLAVLLKHREDVARVVPHAAANVCEMWLRVSPDMMPFRRHIAELAIDIAREIQARNEESNYFSGSTDRKVYEAMLYGAPLAPDRAAALCLELAARRDVSQDVKERAEQAHEKRRQERAKQAPSKAPPPLPPMLGRSSRPREPWPDGPRGDVDHHFRDVCLSGPPYAGLIKAAPEVALEVLLAVCIEEPKEEDFFGGSSFPECGLSYWSDGKPPAYFRGPFQLFCKLAPEQALTFVIKLTNFGTHQYTKDHAWLDITVDGQPKRWYGDQNVYRWHHDGHPHNGEQIESALMALEQWLYDEIDQGRSIDQWIKRIVTESESLAFAGLLMDVGKRAPHLFAGILKPFFFTWDLWHLDFQLANQHALNREYLAYWGFQPRQFIEMARTYYLLPHRTQALLAVNGAIPATMLSQEQHHEFFRTVRENWNGHLEEVEDDSLRRLIERINPGNYEFNLQGDTTEVEFSWPEPLASETAEWQRKHNDDMAVMALPNRCRKFLDENHPLPPDQRDWLWTFLQKLTAKIHAPPEEADLLPNLPLDAMIGGITVLLSTNRTWLEEDPQRLVWCRQQLQNTIIRPPQQRDSAFAVGNHNWDSFAVECGLLLLASDTTDALARSLIAAGATAFRYATTAHLMVRATPMRAQLGEEFGRITTLIVKWAALRPREIRDANTALDSDREAFHTQKQALIQSYVDNTLPSQTPDLHALNAETRATCDAIHERRYPGSAAHRARIRQREEQRHAEPHADHLGLDDRLLSAAFSWIDLNAAQSPDDKALWVSLLLELLGLTLSTIPTVPPETRQQIKGQPSEFDNWLFQVIAKNIAAVGTADNPSSLWKPILTLGAPAHRWVEHFFWHWFTDGFRGFASPADFVRTWQSMIDYALVQKALNPSVALSFDVDAVVMQLLAFDQRWNALFLAEENAPAIATLHDTYERAMSFWGKSPRIIRGYTTLAILPGAKSLLLPGIGWILPAVRKFSSYDWKDDVEGGVVDFLEACWTRQRETIASDASLLKDFLAILAVVTARGSPAAIALNKRVAGLPGA